MFTSELTESRQDRVTLCQIDGSTLSLLVDFMYTSEIRVAEDNVQVRCTFLFVTWTLCTPQRYELPRIMCR